MISGKRLLFLFKRKNDIINTNNGRTLVRFLYMKGVEIPLSKCHVGLLWGGEQGEGPLIDVLEFQKTVRKI